MRLLLDTHVLLWSLSDDPSLSGEARRAIVEGRNQVFVSAASAWEIAIKKRLAKLEAPDDLREQLALHRFTELDIDVGHALAVEALPGHHRDPFDRMLVAQARLEHLTLVTRNERMLAYDVEVLGA